MQTTQALIAAFEKQTGITVNLRSDDEDVLADQIVTEGSRSPADVYFTENTPPLQYLASKGLLASVAPSTLANTPARFNSPDGKWVGVTARVSVMGYNTSLLSPSELPKSVMELADPQWKGKIGIAGSETDFQPIVTSIARAHGEAAALQWLEAVKANAGSHSYPDNETLISEVNRGQVALGVINQYYWYREKAQVGEAGLHSAIATFAPGDPGYVIDVSGAGILKSSSHQAEAQRFLAFLTSKKGQEIIGHSESYEYPIASGRDDRRNPRHRSTSCSRTASPLPNSAPAPRRSSCCRRLNCCDRGHAGSRSPRRPAPVAASAHRRSGARVVVRCCCRWSS